MKNNVIYGYKKVSNQKIVYVGQTTNLMERHHTHVDLDPFNKNVKEYDYPLSRGIRKYGKEGYELVILEDNIPLQDLNEKEKYWIAFYDTYWNGYNQTIGGSNPVMPKFTEEKIDKVIEMLKDESYSYKDIIQKTGISMTHIYNINTGKRRKKDDINYPIRQSNTKGTRGIKFSQEEVLKIHHLLKDTKLSMNNIAELNNCSKSTVSKINSGSRECYKLEGWKYPIRDTKMYSRI